MIIVIDGPEKAGKSTLIELLRKELLRTHVRPWGPVDPDDRVYLQPLIADTTDTHRIGIWDRSWASEHVYAKLLNRDRRLKDDPFLGEWFYGRAAQAVGLRIMLIPEDPNELIRRRDNTDLGVNPIVERNAFIEYAKTFGWTILYNQYTPERDKENVYRIVTKLGYIANRMVVPPQYAGPPTAKIVFVGESRNEGSKNALAGAWLPFTSPLTTQLGRDCGKSAFEYGWTNIDDMPAEFYTDKIVVSCGNKAHDYINSLKYGCETHVEIPHPAWLYRFQAHNQKLHKQIQQKLHALKEHSNG
jgi:hypothetical protein